MSPRSNARVGSPAQRLPDVAAAAHVDAGAQLLAGREGALPKPDSLLGSWVTYHNQVDAESAAEMMAAAFDAGVNFFDNAEVYAGGRSEEIMGAALKA